MIWLNVICILCAVVSIVLSIICGRLLRSMNKPMHIWVIFNDETDAEYTVFGKATIVDGGMIVIDDSGRAITLSIENVRTWEIIDG